MGLFAPHKCMVRVICIRALAAAFVLAGLLGCQPSGIAKAPNNAATMPPPVFMQDHGVLYVREEVREAQTGVSIALGGGKFRDLTTTHEWWIDLGNLKRTRRVTIEWLDDGPHLIRADGSDGVDRWWVIDVADNITQATYHDGSSPFRLPNIGTFVSLFAQSGQDLLEAVQRKQTEPVALVQRAPWGKVMGIRQKDAWTGQVITSTVRADAPHVLIERIVLDKAGYLFESDRLADWEWVDPASLKADFWMTPPKGVQVGAIPLQAFASQSPISYFPRQRDPHPDNMTALLVGRLVVANGCLRVDSADGSSRLPIWPLAFSLRTSTTTAEIVDGSGQLVARSGDNVRMGGGEIPDHYVAELAVQPLPEKCPGPY